MKLDSSFLCLNMKPKSLAEVNQIVEKHQADNSVFIVDLSEVRDKVALWRRELPNIKPYYAAKCNTDPKILRCLSELGPDIQNYFYWIKFVK